MEDTYMDPADAFAIGDLGLPDLTDDQIREIRDAGLTTDTSVDTGSESDGFNWGGLFKSLIGGAAAVAGGYFAAKSRQTAVPLVQRANGPGSSNRLLPFKLPGGLGGSGGGSPAFVSSGGGFALTPTMVVVGFLALLLLVGLTGKR